MPTAAQPDRATEIRAAVEAARPRLPNLAADYADKAVASGKTVDAVKGELLDQMTTSPRVRSKANMQALVAGMKGEAAPGTPAATSRASMAKELKRQGLEPLR